jgi:hypothetical protein
MAMRQARGRAERREGQEHYAHRFEFGYVSRQLLQRTSQALGSQRKGVWDQRYTEVVICGQVE